MSDNEGGDLRNTEDLHQWEVWMRAVSIRVHNFRTFTDAEIALSPYSLLTGANNTGKSNLVAAILVFYEVRKYSEDTDLPKFPTDDQESWIEIRFRPSATELATLKDEYRLADGTFRVRKYLCAGTDGSGKLKAGIYAYVGGELSETLFYGAKNVQQGKLGAVIYIPAVSKLDDHTKLSGPSALRDLIGAVLKRVVENSPAYEDLKSAFAEFEMGFKAETTEDGQSLGSLEQEISGAIEDWGSTFEFVVNPLSPDDLVKTVIGHKVQDDALGQPQDPDAYGQGFQRHLIFSLIRLSAHHKSSKKGPPSGDFSPSLTWILFEEPEAFLHPAQIDVLNASLRSISEEDGS